ncbi:MAG: sporulation protein YqfD [Clostridia bacterium]|nr:sporulation protein YqfD [Clostridia bacterium]
MARAYQFLRGYFTVTATGVHVEKCLNLALANRVYLWNVRRLSHGELTFCVSRRGFSMMEEYARKTNTNLAVISREGLPFLWQSTKKRRVFYVSAALSLGIILLSASFIWTVEIEGENPVSEERIVQALSSYGVGVGRFRTSLDFTQISNRLINDFDEILWANVELTGTKLTVTVVPRTPAPAVIPKEMPTNIVAKKDGCITAIIAHNGDAMVKVGDTVVKDQILISGLIPSPSVGSRYLHSMGEITALTWEEKTLEQKLYRYDKIFTENQVMHRELELPFLKIPLDFRQTIDFYNYDSIIKEKHFLFLTYRETICSEYRLQKVPLSVEEAVNEGKNILLTELSEEGITEFVSLSTDYVAIDEETLLVKVLAECEEELGIPREIIKPTEPF